MTSPEIRTCRCGNWQRIDLLGERCTTCARMIPAEPVPIPDGSPIVGRKSFLSNSLRSRLEKGEPGAVPPAQVLTADPREVRDEHQPIKS